MSTTLTVPELANWLSEQGWSEFAQSLASQFRTSGRLSEAQEASARRMYAKCAQRNAERNARQIVADARPGTPITEPGIYELNGTVYRVRRSQAGNLYALRYTPEGATKADRFVYARGVIRDLRADDTLTAERASQLGRHFGICCICGDELDDQDGLGKTLGIGPVCVRRTYGVTQRQLLARLGLEGGE